MQRVVVLVAAGQIWLVKLPSMLFTFRHVRLFVATAIHPHVPHLLSWIPCLVQVGYIFFCRVRGMIFFFTVFAYHCMKPFCILGRTQIFVRACIQINTQTRSFTILSDKTYSKFVAKSPGGKIEVFYIFLPAAAIAKFFNLSFLIAYKNFRDSLSQLTDGPEFFAVHLFYFVELFRFLSHYIGSLSRL